LLASWITSSSVSNTDVVQKAQAQKNTVKPLRDWKAGQVIPFQYRKGHSVDHKKYSKLTKPAKN